MHSANISGCGGVKDLSGQLITDEEDKLKIILEENFSKLLNEKFKWDKDSLAECKENDVMCQLITEDEVQEAMAKMKQTKAAVRTGITYDLLRYAGIGGRKWITDICNAVIRDGRIPEDWSKSWLTTVYKGKGDVMECGSHSGIKLWNML